MIIEKKTYCDCCKQLFSSTRITFDGVNQYCSWECVNSPTVVVDKEEWERLKSTENKDSK